MTQLDKLEILNSQWKSFANCKSDSAKAYAKTVIMYLMTKKRIGIDQVSSTTYSIDINIKRDDRGAMISIYQDKDCDIHFLENGSQTISILDSVDYFGLTEILIEMWFIEGLVKLGY